MNMKKAVLIAAGCAGVVLAQDKVTVPLSNPSQPATVQVRLLSGSINVTTGAPNQVVVEVTGGSSGKRRGPEPPAGMHRIEGGGGIDAEEDHNTVTISGSMSRNNGDYNIQVPPNCSLKLS